MLPGSCFSIPMLAWRAYGRWRVGLSKFTVPAFFCVAPDGKSAFSCAWFTTGPLIGSTLVGKRPADGPGSGPPTGYVTVKEFESAPPDTSPVKLEYAVFWK